jgi:hypothetical protein
LEYLGTAVVANLNNPIDRKGQPKSPERWENEKRRATLLTKLLDSDLSGLAPQLYAGFSAEPRTAVRRVITDYLLAELKRQDASPR